jgi:hypothetical protein
MNFSALITPRPFAAFLTTLFLIGCSPTFNWREVRGTDVPYVIVMPAKPETTTRSIMLGDLQVMMTMTASEVDQIVFAVGTATLPDAAKATASLQLMKSALVNNINGTIRKEKSSGSSQSQMTAIDIEIIGPSTANLGGQPRLMVVRLIAKENKVYQALIVGPEKVVTTESIDTFFTSFKLNGN